MTQYQVTLNEQTLQRLVTSDSQLAHLLEAILNQVLNAQLSEQLRAQRYERTDERQGYRNGYHGGLTTAVRVQFQSASWQRCQLHLSASVGSTAAKAVQEELHARVRAIFEAPDLPTARTLLAQVVAPTTKSKRRPRLPPWSAVLTMPPPCWRCLGSIASA